MASEQRTAVVTGGARGLGLACARRLVADGARVAVFDLDASAAQAEEARVATLDPDASAAQADGGDVALALDVDVTSAARVAEALAEVTEKLGAPTLLVNAAGLLRATRFADISEAEWDLVLDASVKGTFLCSQACLAGMRDAGFGRIVNFSSTAGKSVSTLGGAHYTTAKAAVLGLTRAMAKELAPLGITVNAICPGLFDTEMTRAAVGAELDHYAASFPIARLGRPEEVAALVGFLCGEEAGYITGAALDVNGGDLMV